MHERFLIALQFPEHASQRHFGARFVVARFTFIRQPRRFRKRRLGFSGAARRQINSPARNQRRRPFNVRPRRARAKIFVGLARCHAHFAHAQIEYRALVQQFFVGQRHPGIAVSARRFIIKIQRPRKLIALAIEIAKGFQRLGGRCL